MKSAASKIRNYDKKTVVDDVLQHDVDCVVQEWPGFIEVPNMPVDRMHNAQLRAKIMATFRTAFTDGDDVSNRPSASPD